MALATPRVVFVGFRKAELRRFVDRDVQVGGDQTQRVIHVRKMMSGHIVQKSSLHLFVTQAAM